MNTLWQARTLTPLLALAAMTLAGCGSKSAEKSESTEKSASSEKTTAEQGKTGVVANPTTTAQNATDNGLDTSYLLADFYMGAVVHPGRVLKSPAFSNPILGDIFTEAQKNMGFDPRDIDRVLVAGDPVGKRFAAVISFSKPIDSTLILSKMLEAGHEKITHNGADYYRNARPRNPSVYFPNNKTVVLALDADLQQMMGKPSTTSELITKLKGLDPGQDISATFIMSGLPSEVLDQVKRNPIPQPFTPLGEVPDLVTAVTIGAKLIDALELKIVLNTRSERDGSRLQQIVGPTVDLGKGLANQQLEQLPPGVSQIAKPILDSITSKAHGADVHVTLKAEAAGATGMLTAMLLPAVQQARAAARHSVQRNRFKQIGLALHNYHETHSHFPAGGKAMLSWRVHILPMLDQRNLYEQFKLDEPWDSEHNIKLVDKMPEIYTSENNPGGGKTTVLAPVTADSIFGGDQPVRFRDITDGSSNTVLAVLVKAKHAVPWTRPADLTVDAADPAAALEPGLRGFLALFSDGSTRSLGVDLEPATFLNLFNKSDGNAVGDLD
ncbi:MAG: DUF1559 domain-containing protein [Planctomycetota bacterium]|nr:DUF1559 domain-containing protein [Planctomycetota bacterium]